MNENPERHVMDDIDALIATELDEHGVPLDDFRKDRYVKCELCHGHWHGLPNSVQCPGAWASHEAKQRWWLRMGYSKSVDTQPNNGPSLRPMGIEQDGRITAVYHDEQGHEVRGTLVFNNPLNAGGFAAIFIPDGIEGEHDYRYLPTESDDSVRQEYSFDSERAGFHADLVLMDEANEIESAWETIAQQAISGAISLHTTQDDTP